MSITYTPATNFGAKDSLPTNDPDKVIKGSEFSTEFTAIQTAFGLAAPAASPTFTGTVTIASVDINGGNIDGTTIGGTTPAAATFTSVTATTADINGGNIDGTVIGAATPAAGSFTTGQFGTSLNVDGTVTADGLTVAGDISVTGGNRTLSATHHLNIDIDSDNNNTDRIFYVTNDGETKTRFVVGESGDISFYEDTGTTPKFFWDASAEALGIGTSSPNAAINVDGSVELAGVLYRGIFGGAYQDSDIGAVTGGNPAAVQIQSITSSRPATLLLGGGQSTNESLGIIGFYNSGNTDTKRLRSYISCGQEGGTSNEQGGVLSFGTAANAGTTPAERMRIDSSGNVGIGTSSPTALLHLSSTAQSTVMHITDASGYGAISNSNGSLYLTADRGSVGSKFMSFRVGGTTERMRIDTSGRLLIGTTDTFPGNGDTNVGIALTHLGNAAFSSDSNRSIFNRNLTDGSIIEFNKDGTEVGSIGTDAGRIYITDDAQAGISFASASQAVVPCTPSGALNDNAVDLGAASARFDDVYATNSTIQTSDANEKQDIAELDEAERRVAVAAKSLLRKFRWKDSVAEKGDDARIHFGIIAQDLQAAFEAEGLDAGRYAMFIHSTWTDEETGEERSRMGVRYSELLAFIIAAL
jgi:hypothetical protein